MISHCHSAPVKEVEGKNICEVCGNECQTQAGEVVTENKETESANDQNTEGQGNTELTGAGEGSAQATETSEQENTSGEGSQLDAGGGEGNANTSEEAEKQNEGGEGEQAQG